MGTDRPLVSILMAVYKPDPRWFKEQLVSLDSQDYGNSELIICDDCPSEPLDEKLVAEYIKNIPYEIVHNENNLGSNKTFERLTKMGRGKYFSYCDQDDIWHPDKVSRMVGVLEKTGSPLVCSDLKIIDGNGKKIADSITEIRKRHVFLEGEGLTGTLLVRNFVTGCAMMIRSEIAKASVPFVDSLVHDHWLAINAALRGRIEVIREPLIDYRQHTGNQTAVLKGITEKQSYYKERLINFMERISDYKIRLYSGDLRSVINELDEFYSARIRYSQRINLRDLRIMKKYRHIAPHSVLLETFMPLMPNFVFKWLLALARKGKI